MAAVPSAVMGAVTWVVRDFPALVMALEIVSHFLEIELSSQRYRFCSTVILQKREKRSFGSTRFKDAFTEAQKRLTLGGNIVISVGLFGHSGDDEVWTEGTKEMLDDMHKRKIDMADEIFVINVGGYIGSSTRSEIEYAKANGKTVRYLVNP